MKTITVSETTQSVHDLLMLAQKSDLLLQAVDGTQYVLMNVSDAESFYIGESDELSDEIEIARSNEAMMKFLDERSERAKVGKGMSLSETRRQLGLQ